MQVFWKRVSTARPFARLRERDEVINLCSFMNSSGMASQLQQVTGRHFFSQCAVGFGSIALRTLLKADDSSRSRLRLTSNPFSPKKAHFLPRAKNVIYLFMAGGPSQLESFDYKPKLQELNGEPIPESFVKGKRFAFMDTFAKVRPNSLGYRCGMRRRRVRRHRLLLTLVCSLIPTLGWPFVPVPVRWQQCKAKGSG